jgi:hypothetical protein
MDSMWNMKIADDEDENHGWLTRRCEGGCVRSSLGRLIAFASAKTGESHINLNCHGPQPRRTLHAAEARIRLLLQFVVRGLSRARRFCLCLTRNSRQILKGKGRRIRTQVRQNLGELPRMCASTPSSFFYLQSLSLNGTRTCRKP